MQGGPLLPCGCVVDVLDHARLGPGAADRAAVAWPREKLQNRMRFLPKGRQRDASHCPAAGRRYYRCATIGRMGDWTKTFIAVLALFGGTAFVVALTTLGAYLCGPTSNTPAFLGFSCDAWIQSVSQTLGGAATLGAVWWSITHGRQEDAADRRAKLTALAYELAEASRQIATAVGHVAAMLERDDYQQRQEVHPGGDPWGAGPAITLEKVIALVAQQPRIALVIYPAVGSEIAHMRRDRAHLPIRATSLIRKWNTNLDSLPTRLTLFGVDDRDLLEAFVAHSAMVQMASLEAILAIENETGARIPL